jgi:hypothetical protein
LLLLIFYYYIILIDLGIAFDERRMNFVEGLEKATRAADDVELLCFCYVKSSDEATLSLFRIFPDPATARDFSSFLSNQTAEAQCVLIQFLSSGIRWRFFHEAGRGRCCLLCRCSFWSWEHFLQCHVTGQRSTLSLEFSTAAFQGDWLGVCAGLREVLLIWVAAQSNQPILFSEDRICTIFEGIV